MNPRTRLVETIIHLLRRVSKNEIFKIPRLKDKPSQVTSQIAQHTCQRWGTRQKVCLEVNRLREDFVIKKRRRWVCLKADAVIDQGIPGDIRRKNEIQASLARLAIFLFLYFPPLDRINRLGAAYNIEQRRVPCVFGKMKPGNLLITGFAMPRFSLSRFTFHFDETSLPFSLQFIFINCSLLRPDPRSFFVILSFQRSEKMSCKCNNVTLHLCNVNLIVIIDVLMSSFGIQSLVVDNRRKFQFTQSFYGVYECIMNVLNNPQYLSESFNLILSLFF